MFRQKKANTFISQRYRRFYYVHTRHILCDNIVIPIIRDSY